MLKEPKQVPKEPKVDTFQKYTQCFAYGVSWINMDIPKESTSFPSINSLLLRTCLDLNTSLLQSHCLIDFLNLFVKFVLSIAFYLLLRASYCFSILNAQKGINGGVLRTIPWQRLWYQVRNCQRKKGEERSPARNKEKLYSCPSAMGPVRAIS